jgi:hypothetical protein
MVTAPLKACWRRADAPGVAAPDFILFQGRILNTGRLVTLAPPRPDNGKFIIEARADGGVTYLEEFEDGEEAAGRYLQLAALLLDDHDIARGVRDTRRGDGTPFRDLRSV